MITTKILIELKVPDVSYNQQKSFQITAESRDAFHSLVKSIKEGINTMLENPELSKEHRVSNIFITETITEYRW